MGDGLSWRPAKLRSARTAPRVRERSVFRLVRLVVVAAVVAASLAALGWIAEQEARSALLQSTLLSRWAAAMTFSPQPGPDPTAHFPAAGPYDRRLGYARMPGFLSAMNGYGYRIERQAFVSPEMAWFAEHGFYPPYPQKDQVGLTLYDRLGSPLHEARFPASAYRDFDEIPPLVVNTLLYLEDRHLLDSADEHRNPAIDWPRFLAATAQRLAPRIDTHRGGGGASTLATQIEKFRHSPQGRTDAIGEKLRQMASAAVLAYRDGPDTLEARKRILVTYLNASPLASRPGVGEIIGIGDALTAWFGTQFAEANQVLKGPADTPAALARKAQVYRQVLSLLLAGRRPAFYLQTDRHALEILTDRYLDRLITARIIDAALGEAAHATTLPVRPEAPAGAGPCCGARKATDALRTELLNTLRVASFYDLDRLDLSAVSTIDLPTETRVNDILGQLNDPDFVTANHLIGFHLLHTARNLRMNYSVMIYERGTDQDEVRVHADTLNEPFDINAGAKLILGSTAKLRTLVTYLNIVTALHDRYADRPAATLRADAAGHDPLTAWALAWLAHATDRGLRPMLDAAMQRRYSAAPGQFFTNSGAHPFHNFETWEDSKHPTVEEAFENSINLAFVRLMRDIRDHFIAENVDAARIMADPNDDVREAYLHRFADEEGRTFVHRFYRQYRALDPAATWALLARHSRPGTDPRVTLFRSVRPSASAGELQAFLALHQPSDRSDLGDLYAKYGPDRFSLADRAYIAGVHPLEIAVVSFLLDHPGATEAEVERQTASQRQDAYAWLFKTHSRHKQDVRLRILLEEDAFDRILQDWRRQGYPFNHLVPSLSTAIGSSGDRPDALAQLIGIVLSGGVRRSVVDLPRLAFAVGTPYETVLRAHPTTERVMAPEVAETIRQALMGVVKNGTAKGLRGAYTDTPEVGGKTGTGDNRIDVFARGGGLISSRPVDRTATFVFFLGDRFYGTVTAYVAGPQAGQYSFTSALAVQVLKLLDPALSPLLRQPPRQDIPPDLRTAASP